MGEDNPNTVAKSIEVVAGWPRSIATHALTGNWKDHRDCHIKPDLVLIYRKPDIDVLQLVRIVVGLNSGRRMP